MKDVYWIIVAIVVLLILSFLYLWNPFASYPALRLEPALEKACRVVMINTKGCATADPSTILFDGSLSSVPEYDANNDERIDDKDTLQALCETHYGVPEGDQSSCRRVCGCPE